MGFLKRFKRLRSTSKTATHTRNDSCSAVVYAYHGPDQTLGLPDKVARRIFEHVCPHAADESLAGSEDSGNDGCMSCDMRDLAHCAMVKRQWYGLAAALLYNSIRIDAVHYCEIEQIYADLRRRKSRNGDDMDVPSMRLQQLCQSVRDNQSLGQRVRFIKLPYMTREACKADIARLVSACPKLEFVDLPDGFFTGDASCQLLRQELQARCPHIRKMKYSEGGESSFETLLHGYWQDLRIVELDGVQIEPAILRQALGMLPRLRALHLSRVRWMNDSTLASAPGIPHFPALHSLELDKIHGVSATALAHYLSAAGGGSRLQVLTIKDCDGLPVSSLHTILQAGRSLGRLRYTATVSAALPLEPLPPLASTSLYRMHYEIMSSSTNHVYPPAASYYQYLANSLLANCLPALRQLYVHDPHFPEVLTLVPPVRPFGEGRGPTFSQPLEVYSRGVDELEWIFTSILPPELCERRASLSASRPLSSYSAHKGLGPQWGGEARKSVVVPNGLGGFLAVPADHARPKSAGGSGPYQGGRAAPYSTSSLTSSGDGGRASWITHAGREKRASRADLWR